jgi:hypothetical protein
MALIQSSRQSAGGGGIEVTGFGAVTVEQTANFSSGGVVITLPHTPLSPNAVWLDYNGQRKYYPSNWALAGNQITILFSDPYVTDYEDGTFFNITYIY